MSLWWRTLSRFVLRASIVIVICLLPWPGLGAAFSTACCWALKPVVGAVHLPAGAQYLDLRPMPDRSHPFAHWKVMLCTCDSRTKGDRTFVLLDVKALVFLPFTIWIAVAFAAPPPAGERFRAFAVGVGLLLGYVALGLVTPAVLFLSARPVGALSVGETRTAFLLIVRSMIRDGACFVPAMLWLFARWTVGCGPVGGTSVNRESPSSPT